MIPSSLGRPSATAARPDNVPRADLPQPKPSSRDWFALIDKGPLSEIECALSAHPDLVAYRDEHDMTALARAIERGHDALAGLLVRSGADVSAPIRCNAAGSVIGLVQSVNAFARHSGCSPEAWIQSVAELHGVAPLAGCDELSLAVSARKRDLIAALVARSGPSVLGILDGLGHTALTRAIQERGAAHQAHHAHALVEHLLSLGADPNMPDARHRTPLMLAAWAGDDVLVGMLTRCGASFCPSAPDGSTPLSLAALGGHAQLLSQLLNAMHADAAMDELERRNQLSHALQMAALASELACVQKLLELAPTEIDDEAAGAALRMACQVIGGEALSLSLLARCNGSFEALRFALRAGQPEAASRLLERGLADDVSPKVVCELLDAAARSGSASIFEIVWHRLGAKVLENRPSRGRALSVASGIGSLDAVRQLVKSRAAVDRTHGRSAPPLIQACAGGHLEVAEFLVASGADINQDNRRGVALVVAAEHGQTEVVGWLMTQGGASLQRTDPSGTGIPIVVAAAVRAVRNGRIDALRVLLAKSPPGMPFGTALNTAAACGNAEAIDLLLHHGTPIEGADAHGWTPLSAAASAGCLYGARSLIERGANPAKGSPLISSPIACAADSGNEELIDYLLTRCADPRQALADALVAASGAPSVRHLLTRGAGAREHQQAIELALKLAFERNDTATVGFLLDSDGGRALSATSLSALDGWARLGMMAGTVAHEAYTAISRILHAHGNWPQQL